MKILFNVQWGKKHLSWRGTVCNTQMVEAYEMLDLAVELAVRAEKLGHLAIVQSYGTMRHRGIWANQVGFDVAVGLTLTRTYPTIFYAEKWLGILPEEVWKNVASYLVENNSLINATYKVFPLRRESPKLSLISYYDPERVKGAFVIAPYSCESTGNFSRLFFVNSLLSAIETIIYPTIREFEDALREKST